MELPQFNKKEMTFELQDVNSHMDLRALAAPDGKLTSSRLTATHRYEQHQLTTVIVQQALPNGAAIAGHKVHGKRHGRSIGTTLRDKTGDHLHMRRKPQRFHGAKLDIRIGTHGRRMAANGATIDDDE